MRTKDFFYFLFSSGLSAFLLPLLWPLLETNADRVSALLPWGSGGSLVIFGLFVTVLIVSIAGPGFALRRITEKIPLWVWVLGWLGYRVVLVALFVLASRVFGSRLAFAEKALVPDPQWIWMNWVNIGGPTENVHLLLGLAGSFVTPLLCWAPGSLIIALYNRSVWFGLRFSTAMAAGSLVSMLAAVVLAGFVPVPTRHHFIQNGFDRFDSDDVWFLATAFLTAAIGAIATLFVLVAKNSGARADGALVARPVGWGISVGAACLVLPMAVAFVIGPSGYRSGFPVLQRLVSTAPVVDVVEGRDVLVKHKVVSDLRTGAWPERSFSFIAFAPDSTHMLAMDSERAIVSIDMKSGKAGKTVVSGFVATRKPFPTRLHISPFHRRSTGFAARCAMTPQQVAIVVSPMSSRLTIRRVNA